MRSDRIATCTSSDPVSPDLVAYSPMSACLRSGVIDIGLAPSTIDDAHRPKTAILDPRQSNKKLILPHADDRAVLDSVETRPLARVLRRDPLTVTQSIRFFCRHGERRDVVQRRLDRQQMLGNGETMPKRHGGIQRNRLAFGKAADGKPAQLDDVAERAQRLRQV